MPAGTTSLAPDVLEAVYKINKHAKKYAELASENYRQGKKANAKANSCKKEALYAVKSQVLAEVKSEATRIARHTINGENYYCLYFDEWSFHAPVHELDVDESAVDETDTLEEFDPSSDAEHTSLSLKEALLHLETEFGLNANEYLPETYVSYGYQNHFAGWSYLGDQEETDTAEQTSTNGESDRSSASGPDHGDEENGAVALSRAPERTGDSSSPQSTAQRSPGEQIGLDDF